jgi:signal transduction histidine kinase
MAKRRRSLSGPIVLSSVSVALSIAMLVGWIFVLIRSRELTKGVVLNTWMLIGGVASLITIITVLVLFTVFLAREVGEVRRQDSFIDSVTHELRSPLAAIRLCIETMRRKGLAPEKREELQRMMFEDITRLESLIDAVLMASRVGSARGLSSVARVSFKELIEASVARVTKRHQVSLDVVAIEFEASFTLRSDPSILSLIFDNVIDNAIKYSGGPPSVHVKVFERGRSLRVSISDQGIGISKRDLKRIFDRFYRVPEESVRTQHGTGLGLFIVAAVVRNMGGKIKATSEGPGRGTEVTVRLPSRLIVAPDPAAPNVS